jgi:hypothetical protein
MNVHPLSVESNFKDESGHAIKLHVIKDYNANTGFVDKSDRMVNSYGIAWRIWKWTKMFFHLTDITTLNAFLIHKPCGGNITHTKKLQEFLVRDLVIQSHKANVTASGMASQLS